MATTLQELYEAGCHFGHLQHRWNPKIQPYLFGAKGGVHIIDLAKTLEGLEAAEKFVENVTSEGGQVLFVGTKRQAAPVIRSEAERCLQPFISERWFGGTLTNFRTIRERVRHLEQLASGEQSGESEGRYTKKEFSKMVEERKRLEKTLGGIRIMQGLPAALFVVDVGREDIAISEARSLSIPVIALIDTNANPDLVDYPIPANDDAIRSIKLLVGKIADAALRGGSRYDATKTEEPEVAEAAA